MGERLCGAMMLSGGPGVGLAPAARCVWDHGSLQSCGCRPRLGAMRRHCPGALRRSPWPCPRTGRPDPGTGTRWWACNRQTWCRHPAEGRVGGSHGRGSWTGRSHAGRPTSLIGPTPACACLQWAAHMVKQGSIASGCACCPRIPPQRSPKHGRTLSCAWKSEPHPRRCACCGAGAHGAGAGVTVGASHCAGRHPRKPLPDGAPARLLHHHIVSDRGRDCEASSDLGGVTPGNNKPRMSSSSNDGSQQGHTMHSCQSELPQNRVAPTVSCGAAALLTTLAASPMLRLCCYPPCGAAPPCCYSSSAWLTGGTGSRRACWRVCRPGPVYCRIAPGAWPQPPGR